MKKCNKCLEEKTEDNFKVQNKNTGSLMAECKQCTKIRLMKYNIEHADRIKAQKKEFYEKNKDKIREARQKYLETSREAINNKKRQYIKTLEVRFSAYKSSAKQRNIDFNLTIDQFSELWQKPCTYCHADVNTIGIDRIDNNLPYQAGNIISCCFVCNNIKGDLSKEQMIEHLSKIIARKDIILQRFGLS